MKAMIFAAGYGKRLQPLTNQTPKPLIEVQDRSMLDWIIQQLQYFGVSEIIINTHYLAEKIHQHLESHKIEIKISFEKEILGTGGGLLKTFEFWDNNDFYLCNSDILCTADLNSFFEFHKQTSSLATLATNKNRSNSMLLIDEQGLVVGIQRNNINTILKSGTGDITPVGFCGMHVVNPTIFEWFEIPIQYSIIDEYLKVIAKGGEIYSWPIGDAYWTDIGSIESLENANKHFPGFNY